jgi:glycosyltransferase involved in cell wall biosynthesis
MDELINNTAFFLLAKNKPGGGERRFLYLYEYYLKKNYSPYLIANNELLDNLNVAFNKRVFSEKLNGIIIFSEFYFILNALIFIKKENIKHVHFCINPSKYSLLMIPVLKLFRCKISISLINSIVGNGYKLSVFEKIYWEYSIRNSDRLDILSPSIYKNMLNIFDKSILSRKNEISICSFSKSVDSLNTSGQIINNKKKYDFIFASRLIPGKGLELLMLAIQKLDEEGIAFNILICGEGPLANSFLDKKFNYIKINYFGYVDNVLELLLLSDCALSLQEYENYPSQFLLEALAAKCKIIATDVGDTRMLLNDDVSILIKNDAGALKQAMLDSKKVIVNSELVNELLEKNSISIFSKYFIKLISNVPTK